MFFDTSFMYLISPEVKASCHIAVYIINKLLISIHMQKPFEETFKKMQ